MHRLAHRQQGMTYLGLLIILGVIAFFAMIAIKVVPLYVENMKVDSTLKSLQQSDAPLNESDIRATLRKRFDINDVAHVRDEDVKVVREGKALVVTVDYEARVPLFANIDLIARFPDNRVELTSP